MTADEKSFYEFLRKLGLQVRFEDISEIYARGALDSGLKGSVTDYFFFMSTARDSIELNKYLQEYIVVPFVYTGRLGLNVSAIKVPRIQESFIGAMEGATNGDIEKWFGDNMCGQVDVISVIRDNQAALSIKGIYESVLANAYITRITDDGTNPLPLIKSLFQMADKAKLRPLGETPTYSFPLVLYRGIANPAQDPDGISWTNSLDCACWFAGRQSIGNPRIYETQIEENEYLLYTNRLRTEDEFIILPSDSMRPVDISKEEIMERCARWQAKA